MFMLICVCCLYFWVLVTLKESKRWYKRCHIQGELEVPSKPNPPGCGMQYIVHTYNVIMYLYFYLCLFFSVFLIQGIQGEFKVPSRPNPPGCGIQDNQSRPAACGGTRATISECDKVQIHKQIHVKIQIQMHRHRKKTQVANYACQGLPTTLKWLRILRGLRTLS